MFKKILLFISFFLLLIFTAGISSAESEKNRILSVEWNSNTLRIKTAKKISYTEARLKDPERLVVDILNCSLSQTTSSKSFKSRLGETISISEPNKNQVRIIFVGDASINRKVSISENEKNLNIKIYRISDEVTEDIVVESTEHTEIKKYKPGTLKVISIDGDNEKSEVSILTSRPVKYNTYLLKDPTRFAIDLLNILPPNKKLPKFSPTELVTGVRVGRAASGLEATRVVVDLAMTNISWDIDSNLLGNRIKIKFSTKKEKEKKKDDKDDKKKSNNSKIKVVIDPGHGGYDQGASYGGFEEKNVNLAISEKLKKTLEEYGITVFLIRNNDGFLSLAERVEITNSIKPNVFISIHANALNSKAIRGVETYYWTPQSQKLAYNIHKGILKHIAIPDHHIRKARFYVIKYTPVPAVLAELGFLSNADDRKLLTNPSIQEDYANALTEGILKFLGIEYKKKEKPKEEEKAEDKKKE